MADCGDHLGRQGQVWSLNWRAFLEYKVKVQGGDWCPTEERAFAHTLLRIAVVMSSPLGRQPVCSFLTAGLSGLPGQL